MARRKKAKKRTTRARTPGMSKANMATGALLGVLAPQFLGQFTPYAMLGMALIPGGFGLGAIGKAAATTWAANQAKNLIQPE